MKNTIFGKNLKVVIYDEFRNLKQFSLVFTSFYVVKSSFMTINTPELLLKVSNFSKEYIIFMHKQ